MKFKFTIDEAIHALKHINLIRVHPFYSWEEMKEIRDMAIEALESVRTFIPKPEKWIPFTIGEDGLLNCKLPEEDEEILVSGGGSVWEDTFMCGGVGCYLDTWGGDLIGLAWMPKPEPWKGEK